MAAVRDMRPVDVVVHAAAASVGEQDNAAPAVKAIREHGVRWAFQLAQAGAEDWRPSQRHASPCLTAQLLSEPSCLRSEVNNSL